MGYTTPPKEAEETSSDLDLERLNAGWLGKFFGVGDNAANNIAGMAVVVACLTIVIGLLLGGTLSVIFSFFDVTSPFEIWSHIAPIITTALGYIFGRGTKS